MPSSATSVTNWVSLAGTKRRRLPCVKARVREGLWGVPLPGRLLLWLHFPKRQPSVEVAVLLPVRKAKRFPARHWVWHSQKHAKWSGPQRSQPNTLCPMSRIARLNIGQLPSRGGPGGTRSCRIKQRQFDRPVVVKRCQAAIRNGEIDLQLTSRDRQGGFGHLQTAGIPAPAGAEGDIETCLMVPIRCSQLGKPPKPNSISGHQPFANAQRERQIVTTLLTQRVGPRHLLKISSWPGIPLKLSADED